MISVLLVGGGIILLAYSALLCHRLNSRIDNNIAGKLCFLILVLVYFFIAGYLVYLVRLIMTFGSHGMSEILVSTIFFFGATFVVAVLKANHKLIYDLAQNTERLSGLNRELETKNKELRNKTEALKVSEKKYRDKSKELEETMEDFYTLRLSMEEQIKEGVVEEENRKIKERLDELKVGNNDV